MNKNVPVYGLLLGLLFPILGLIVTYLIKFSGAGFADFERYLEMIIYLVRIKAVDADDYFWLTDCYATAVKGEQSSFGWKMGLKKETIVDNPVIRKRRSQLGLVPKEYMEYLAH